MTDTDTYLPDPAVRIGGRKFWRRRAVREYIARIAGEPPPAPIADDEQLLGSLELRMWLGGVSEMWIHRHSRRQENSEAAAPPTS
jgi:hypothetical protein